MPRQNPCGCLPGHCYIWLKLYGNKHPSASQSAENSLAQCLYLFTSGSLPQGLYLVVSAGLISFTIASSIFRLKSTPSYSRPAAMRSAMAASSAM